MSLVGNLEDLGLGEILQIVSLSRKSGVLELNSRGRSGKIIFRAGQVIRATATTFPENIGDLLLRGGMVDLETLKQALIVQQRTGDGRRVGDILVDQFGVSRQAIDTVVREQIERIVYSFFGWAEGDFAFELGEPEELAATILNPLYFMLESGLNPQWLAMEGSRLVDEKRHRGENLDEHGESHVNLEELLAEARHATAEPVAAADAVPSPAKPVATAALPGQRAFLILDDDPGTGDEIAFILQNRQLEARAFVSRELFMAAVATADPVNTTAVIDLIMPHQGGGIFGGLEVLEEICRAYPKLPVLAMAEHLSPETEKQLRRFGIPALLPKPSRADVATGMAGQALSELADALCSLAGQRRALATRDKSLFDIGAELYREMGEASGLTPRQERQTPGLHLLRGMLEELNNPSLGGGIILLILRFASELMNRAVIFLVKEKEIVGLGQFGIELPGKSADTLVGNTRIPTCEESFFKPVLTAKAPAKVVLSDTQWDNYLCNQFGGTRPREVFLGPLISEGRVVAILYGDNLPEEKPIGDTEALEIFLSEAGLAMEKGLSARRLTGSRAAV